MSSCGAADGGRRRALALRDRRPEGLRLPCSLPPTGYRLPTSLERQPNSELQHSWPVRDVRVEGRLAEERVAFVRRVRTVIRMVEQVEHFEHAIQPHVADDRNALLETHIHAVNLIADEIVPRNDRAVRTQPLLGGCRAAARAAGLVASIRPGIHGTALAGAEEVDPAHLETSPHVPDPVRRQAVTLIASGIGVIAAHVGGQWKTERMMVDDPVAPDEPLLTEWRRVLEVRKRIASCELPVVAST
jgi:hypothetical protein